MEKKNRSDLKFHRIPCIKATTRRNAVLNYFDNFEAIHRHYYNCLKLIFRNYC